MRQLGEERAQRDDTRDFAVHVAEGHVVVFRVV